MKETVARRLKVYYGFLKRPGLTLKWLNIFIIVLKTGFSLM